MFIRIPTRRTALLMTAGAALASAAGGAAAAAKSPLDGGITLGRAQAPVTVTEYASVTCGHCAHWDAEVWPAFKAKYVDSGKVRFELKEMLTPPVQVATAGWLLARCVGDEKYLSVVEGLYRGQAEMARTGNARGVLLDVGRRAGLTDARIMQCVSDPQARAALNSRVEAAVAQGVDSTPTFFINGRKHEGDISMAGLDAVLAPLLARRR